MDETPTIATKELSVASLGDVMNSGQLRAAIKTAETQRQLIKEFVKNQLIEGTDYGVIVGNKPTLLKPGQEKIFSLMKLTSRLEKDADTLEMLGSKPGQIAYLCRVYRGGEEIAQGRGAAVVGDKKRDENATIKIAEKRARMDACLSLGFSEFFTQDLEDGDYNGQDESKTTPPATIKQKNLIAKLFLERGATTPRQLLASIQASGVADPKAMTTAEASDLIERIFANSPTIEVVSKVTYGDDIEQKLAEDEKKEQEQLEDIVGRGPGDPDVHGYPGDTVDETEYSEEEIAKNLAEAEAQLLGDNKEDK